MGYGKVPPKKYGSHDGEMQRLFHHCGWEDIDAVHYGKDDQGLDCVWYGATASTYVWWDESTDTWYFGQDDYGPDVYFYGATASTYTWWDASTDTWYFGQNDYGPDVYMYGGVASTYVWWDASAGRLTIQKTFASAGQVATYEYGQYIGMAFNTAAATGKYIAGLKIAMEGTGNYDSTTQLYPLWIDFQNTGTNSSTYTAHILLQAQAGACLPSSYIMLHTASPGVDYLFKFMQDHKPLFVTAATGHGGTVRTIKLDVGGTAYYLLASTAPA